jgi:hypothetical protein
LRIKFFVSIGPVSMAFRGKEDGFRCVFRGLGGFKEVLKSF